MAKRPNIFSRIVKRFALRETQLLADLNLAGFLQFVAGQSREMDLTARKETGEQAYNAYRTNPMGYNFVNVMTNFLFGPGVQFSHPDEPTNESLQDFLRKEKFGRKLIELANGYRVEGVRFVLAFANTLTGEVKVREIDPLNVTNVVTAPGDYEDIVGLYCEYLQRVWSDDGRTFRDEQVTEYITQDQHVGGYTIRHFFVWKRPTVAGDTRGWSFLTPVLHYLVQFREFLKTRLNLQKALSMFAWKWSLKGLQGSVTQKQADAAAFKTVLDNAAPISAGSQLVAVPGSDVESGYDIEPISAGISAGTTNAMGDARALGLQVAVGTSTPEGVAMGDWSNANYSSLSLSIQTFIKNIQAEQTIWGRDGFLGEFFDWWLGIQRDARFISEEAAGTPVNVVWPVILPDDPNATKNMLEFLVREKIVSKRTALAITPYDVEYDTEKENLEVEAQEAEDRRNREIELFPPQPVIAAPDKPNGKIPGQEEDDERKPRGA